jgi:ATP phosphoribosyltransferase regulatory subunit
VLTEVVAALARKDAANVTTLAQALPVASRDGLLALLRLYGGEEVLGAARRVLPQRAAVERALDELGWLASHVRAAHPDVSLGFDLADLSGYAYYSGPRFALYAAGTPAALARGGRYDEVGAVFGRNRAAVGFSLDVKALAAQAEGPAAHPAIHAAWGEDTGLRAAIRRLRAEGHTVVCTLPGHENEAEEYDCDRELVALDGRWVVRPL